MRCRRATSAIERGLDLPQVHLTRPSETRLGRLPAGLERPGAAADPTTDPHLVLLAMEAGRFLSTTDGDFARLPESGRVTACTA
jgi:hypothetical protein